MKIGAVNRQMRNCGMLDTFQKNEEKVKANCMFYTGRIMKLPNATQAIIPSEKLRDYLLSYSHPVGKFKAVFFQVIGYTNNNWEELETAIRSLLIQEALIGEQTKFGQKYEVSGSIICPSGKIVQIVTAWIILKGEVVPRFITAYPGD